ncbi:MAG: matrixin family metalloprotease [Dehalococcoidales bacterium]|nr:matrixin family metalloprotease [Dehalococcoidales bacterium]
MRKCIIGLLVISLLVMVFPSSVVIAKPENKPITPSDLKNITLIHYVKPDSPPGKPDVPDDEDPSLPAVNNTAYALLGCYLPRTVTYYVNTAGAPEGALDEIKKSFDAWDLVTEHELFVFGSTTSTSGARFDYQNTVSWRKIAPRNIIAMTSLWYNGTTGEIYEFDITFNSFLKWGIDPDDEEDGTTLLNLYDVENIAVHEVGHVVGLADLYEDQYRELTMYGYGAAGETIKITLEIGDIAGAQFLYGNPDS